MRSSILLASLLAIVTTACASSGAVPRPFPTPGGGPSPSAPDATRASGYGVSGTALSLVGAPYRDGGTDPRGFDCSGFVQYVFAQYGVALPHSVAEQSQRGRRVGLRDLAPGDLLFFSTVAAGASHVGIALGGEEFVHAPSSRGEVRVERISAPYWATRLVEVRRLL